MFHVALAVLMLALQADAAEAASPPATTRFAAGAQADFQALLDAAPPGAIVVCEQTAPLEVSQPLVIRKPLTLSNLKACLPPKLGKTSILVVDAPDVVLEGLELRGNYDSVDQKERAPLVHVLQGGFRIEHCKFCDATKDGIMVTPEHGTGDIVGGTIRHIEGERIGRDLVSLSGGNLGQRIRNVTVEDIRLVRGFLRGAVEVSDGTDNITVRRVYAQEAVYAIDVQDHGLQQDASGQATAPNTNVTLEDITAVDCRHAVRTANHPQLRHATLVLRNITARNCAEPLRLRNTTGLRAEKLAITNDPPLSSSPIELHNVHDALLRNVTIKGLKEGVEAVGTKKCSQLAVENLTTEQ